jgi:hypothetical protein
MSAEKRLANARARIDDGNYEEALLDLIWFHHHALSESRAWAGVRLSYALSDWIRLGELYPPAMAALENTRDEYATGLLAGDLEGSVFRDVASINDHLGTTQQTCELYRKLIEVQPELARSCAAYALPAIVQAKDYYLAAQLIPVPEVVVRRHCEKLNRNVQQIKFCSYAAAPRRWVYTKIFVDDMQLLLSVLNGTGRYAEAARLKALAISLIESPSLRREVQAGFVKMPRAPMLVKMARAPGRRRRKYRSLAR